MFIHINGQIVPKGEAHISPFDHGYLYGIGLFETLRVYNKHPFLLADHIERLNKGLELVGINLRRSVEEWKKEIDKLLEANQYEDAYIRINVSAGNGETGLQSELYNHPTVIIFSKPLPAHKHFPEKEAVILKTKRNTPETEIRLKSHHFLNNIMAKRELGNMPNREGIFLNEKGIIAEGIVSNLFWVKNGTVYTPAIETGILNGITRQFVGTLLKQKDIPIQEGFYSLKHLLDSDEAFMTNSIQEIVPFHTVEKRNFPGNDGELTRILLQEYRKYREKLVSHNQLKLGVD